jgi:2,3-dihydroxy-2,3-dihydro-p-cumate dehydrogenase
MRLSADGDVVLITGAASGIGRAMVARFASAGARLALADLDQAALESCAEELAPDALIHVCDLSGEEGAQVFVEAVRESFGRVDVLVNNAGGGVILPFEKHTPDTMRATIDRNLWTCLWTTREVLPMMVSRNYGRIVNIGADSVRNGLWGHAVYNAAKGGMHGLTTGLAREYASHDITVNTVAPAMIRTALVEEETARGNPMIAKFLSVIPKGRCGEPDEVASIVQYLATREAAFITGQIISVNGGSTMQ